MTGERDELMTHAYPMLSASSAKKGAVSPHRIEIKQTDRLWSLLRESLVIGGWVAMWRPLEIYLYDWWPRRIGRIYEKLSRVPVEIVEEGPS